MQVIIGGRQTGKTTRLIKECAEAEARGEVSYIVCHSGQEARRIAQIAKEKGLQIGFPLTYDEFLKGQYSSISQLYIDNVDMLIRYISRIRVEAVTINVN
jgi:hypothetical protein